MENCKRVPFSRIRPGGWMKNTMSDDLENGFIGHLDELLPALIPEDDIYGKDRRGAGSKVRDLGLAAPEEAVSAEYQWWNAETQSNWLDGFARTAFLAGSPEMRQKAEKYLQKRLATQDEDGYLGIYDRDMRYRQGRENGELWAQSALFRALIAYYEYTDDPEVLAAVSSAARLTMDRYPKEKSAPFSAADQEPGMACGGLAHGLTIVDAYFWLAGITGEREYLDYAVWLYESASGEPVFQSDVRSSDLCDPDYRFCSHGVQTYEHLRAVTLAKYFGDKPEFEKAYQGYLDKLEDYICPSGGPAGDEWICPSGADATMTGYEYCSLQELLHSYALLLELSGELRWADRIERLFFNAALGAHHTGRSSVTYLKTDNCFELCSSFPFYQEHVGEGIQTRYKYSPTHQDAAVCCVPNAGRIFPYYVQSMWLRCPEGFLKALYGPGEYRDTFEGTAVRITETSHYPVSGSLTLSVETEEPVQFTLFLRKPGWCRSLSCSVPYEDRGDVIAITENWRGEQKIEIEFAMEAIQETDRAGDVYYTCGPLVLALPADSEETIVKRHPLEGFYDTEHRPVLKDAFAYSALQGELPRHRQEQGGSSRFGITAAFSCRMRNDNTGKAEEKLLTPMADTILRRVTFHLADQEDGACTGNKT